MSDLSVVKSIFLEAIEAKTGSDRDEYLQNACGGDSSLRGRVDALLVAYENPDSFFEHPMGSISPPGDAPTIDLAKISEQPGATVGRYKLLQEIGEGGFGVVYMAEQTEPVQRKVALKIIKPGMDSRQVIARFEAERQALALMDHHNIARVLDAGTTDAGLPYFVMELVKGVPITEYCDDHKLSPRERLELFIPVCHAVQHAHQKGVIHRDLKPSNVLVALYDGRPVPKVIDFGVAKATRQSLTQRTMFTELGQIIGTFQYMSPEQAEMNQLDIDTRSDVYSLGVLLYELLTGSTPIASQKIREAGLAEMLRTIRETEPPKPSTRLTESGDTLASISAARKTEPDRLSRLLRGDLDWIVMKTLEKDRSRRYDSANDLAADIERHLHREPVLAAAPSTAYRIQKFVSRNTSAVAAGAILVLLLLGFGGVSAYQARVANQSAVRARAAEKDAQQSLQREHDSRLVAEQERERAKTAKVLATNSESQALDQLARSEYEQARTVRLLGAPGARFQALKLLEQAELLRNRQKKEATDSEHSTTTTLPTQSQLRSEAVAALLEQDGRVTQTWDGMAQGISPNGRFLASLWIDPSAESGGMRVVEVESHRRLYDVSGDDAQKVLGIFLAVRSDGKQLAAVQMDRRSIKLIEIETGNVERTLTIPGGSAPGGVVLTFSPNGRWLLLGTGILNAGIVLWDLHNADQSEGRTIGSTKSIALVSAAFGPRGELLAWVSSRQEVALWNLLEDREQRTIELPLRLDGGVDFMPDGSKLIVHGYQNDQENTDGKSPEANSVDENNPSQTRAGAVLIWDLEQQEVVAQYATNLARLPKVLDVSDDGQRIAIGQMNGAIDVLTLETGEQLPLNHGAMLQAIQWTADGQHLVSAGPGAAKLWELSGQTALERVDLKTITRSATVLRFALSPQDDIVAAENARSPGVGLYDLKSGRRLHELENPSAPFPVAWLTFVPGGEQLLRFGFEEVLLWNVDGTDVGEAEQPGRIKLEEFNEVYDSVGFSADGALLIGGLKNYVPEVRDLLTGKTVWTRNKRILGATVRVSHDGKLVVSHDEAFEGHPRSIAIRELPSGKLLQQFPSASAAWAINTLLEISADNRWVLELGLNGPVLPYAAPLGPGGTGMVNAMSADDQLWHARLWNVKTGQQQWHIAGDSGAGATNFSADGRYLAIAQRNGTVLLWDVEAKQKLFQWQAWPQDAKQVGLTHQLAFTGDGHQLVVADGESPAINLLDIEMLRRELEEIGMGW